MRIRVYTYVSAVAGGIVSITYPYQGEYWARLDPPNGAETNIAERADYKLDAVVLFADDIPISPKGLLRDASTGTLYKIEAVLPRRQTREQTVHASAATDAQASYAITGDPASD
jgi:hypothetical protein